MHGTALHALLPVFAVAAVFADAPSSPPVVEPETGIGFLHDDYTSYAAAFDDLISASYTTPLPSALSAECAEKGAESTPTITVELTSPTDTIDASAAQLHCNSSVTCVVPANVLLRMDSNLRVGALVVRGSVRWDDTTQAVPEQWLCAGYVAFEDGSRFDMNLASSARRAFIYMQANGLSHGLLGERAFGGIRSDLHVVGRTLRRTWSLLASPAESGASSIALLHDPREMGWQVGDRLMLAPTSSGSQGTADSAEIVGFGARNTVVLSAPLAASYAASFHPGSGPGHGRPLSAEVIHLSRNVVFTGDDLTLVEPCAASTLGAQSCTMGLHIIQMYGGTMRLEHLRVEKCGQRGLEGKYCMHLHAVGECAQCSLHGNAIEMSHQRGIVVHGTHRAAVTHNVLADVRGAGIYVEDGNEMHNRFLYNVAVCPWNRDGPLRGCTVPGTNNAEADTALNGAGLWALSAANHFVGNRFANHFNGLFIQANFDGGNGRGFAEGEVCCTPRSHRPRRAALIVTPSRLADLTAMSEGLGSPWAPYLCRYALNTPLLAGSKVM